MGRAKVGREGALLFTIPIPDHPQVVMVYDTVLKERITSVSFDEER